MQSAVVMSSSSHLTPVRETHVIRACGHTGRTVQ